jgi:hypothetical protein
MRCLLNPANLRTKALDSYRPWPIQQMKRPGKTKFAVMRRLFLMVGGRDGAAIRRVKAKLGPGKTVKCRSLRKLRACERKQKRLHNERIDGRRADQPLPVSPPSRAGLVRPDAHQRELTRIGILNSSHEAHC